MSTAAQLKNGVSLQDQQQQLDAFAEANNLCIAAQFSDAHSARGEQDRSERPGFNDACKLALKNDWPILVSMCNRFTRTYQSYQRFEAKDGVLLSVELGAEAMNASQETIRALIRHGEAEIEQRRRTADLGMKRASAEGRLRGNPELPKARQTSIAVRKGNALERYEEFGRQLKLAYADGAKTLREVAASFKAAGFKTSQDRKWKPGNIDRVIKTIAALKAAGDAETASPAIIGNAEKGFVDGARGAAPTLVQHTGDLSIELNAAANENDANQSGAAANNNGPLTQVETFVLSAEQLAEFWELLESNSDDARKNQALLKLVSSPMLPEAQYASILAWIAKKRAIAA